VVGPTGAAPFLLAGDGDEWLNVPTVGRQSFAYQREGDAMTDAPVDLYIAIYSDPKVGQLIGTRSRRSPATG
jgi:hypothetical protein